MNDGKGNVRPLEAEEAVMGAILIDARSLGVVQEILRPEDLALEVHRAIYRSALALQREGRPIDPVVIREEAKRQGADIDAGYLVALMDRTPTAANVKAYCEIAKKGAVRRALDALCDGAKEQAAREDPESVLVELVRKAEDLQHHGTTDDLIRPVEAMLAFFDHRDAVDRGENRGFVPTGYRDLDWALGGGLLASGFYILAARPGMGKTTLALNIADRVAAERGPVLFVSLEMDVEQLVAKRLSRLCGVPSNRVLMGKLSQEEYNKLAAAEEKLESVPLYLNRAPEATVDQVEALARKVKGLSLVVVDYVGKITPERWAARNGRVDAMTEVSGALKTLARTLKIPVLGLAQLNRANESRPDKRPQLSDLRDTGALEQDADGVVFLYRDWYYHKEERDRDPYAPEPLEVDVAKNRHGPTGKCELAVYLGVSKVVAVSSDPRVGMKQALGVQG